MPEKKLKDFMQCFAALEDETLIESAKFDGSDWQCQRVSIEPQF